MKLRQTRWQRRRAGLSSTSRQPRQRASIALGAAQRQLCPDILIHMPDEPRLPPVGNMSGGESSQIVVTSSGGLALPYFRTSATLTVGGIRDAVQELRDSSLEELRRLLAEYDRANKAGHTVDSTVLAAHAETTGMPSLAKLIRAGAKLGIMTIITAIISGPVNYEESNLLHWTPPSITVIQQMSPAQMDELARQIERHLEQMARRQEARHEHHHHHEHR
jgi:hypothetical protein